MSDITHWLVATFVVLLASAVQGLTGFGFAILAVPLLALVLESHQAVAVCTVLSVISVIGMWWLTRRQDRLPISGRLFAAALVGLPLGVLALGFLAASWLKLGAGLATLAVTAVVVARTIVIGSRRMPRDDADAPPIALQAKATFPAGLLSGFLTGCLAMPGPPIVVLLSGGGVPKAIYRATLLAYFAMIYPVASIAMGASGLISHHDVAIGLSHVPALGVGAWLGDILHDRIRESVFTNLSLLLLAGSGLACVWAAMMSLAGSG